MAGKRVVRRTKLQDLAPNERLNLPPALRGALSDLQEPSSIEKIMEIDEHMACAMSGLTADAKMLIDHARAETQVRLLSGRVRTSHCAAGACPPCLLARSLQND